MKKLKRADVIPEHQTEFSPMLFDILFGLLLFMSIGWFFVLKDASHFFFFLVSIGIVVHWWMKYKSEESAYGLDVNNSSLDLIFGVIELVLLEAAMLAASQADYAVAIFYFALPLLSESVWALLWRLLGKWRRSSRKKVEFLETLLERTVFLDLGAAAMLGGLLSLSDLLTAGQLIAGFAAIYATYVALTYLLEIVETKLF